MIEKQKNHKEKFEKNKKTAAYILTGLTAATVAAYWIIHSNNKKNKGEQQDEC